MHTCCCHNAGTGYPPPFFFPAAAIYCWDRHPPSNNCCCLMLGLAPPSLYYCHTSQITHPPHLQLEQAHQNRHTQPERGRAYTRAPYRQPSHLTSPHPHPARGPHHRYQRSRSRCKCSNSPQRRRSASPHRFSRSPHRSHSSDAKQRCHFRTKAPPVCPKCLGRHKNHSDHPICNEALLWDKSKPTRCSRDQHGRC